MKYNIANYSEDHLKWICRVVTWLCVSDIVHNYPLTPYTSQSSCGQEWHMISLCQWHFVKRKWHMLFWAKSVKSTCVILQSFLLLLWWLKRPPSWWDSTKVVTPPSSTSPQSLNIINRVFLSPHVILWFILRNTYLVIVHNSGIELLKSLEFLWWEQ